MNEIQRQFPRPELSPFFTARVVAQLDKSESSAPRALLVLRLYWLLAGASALFIVSKLSWPPWMIYAAVPAGFAAVLGSRQTLLRWLAPFLK